MYSGRYCDTLSLVQYENAAKLTSSFARLSLYAVLEEEDLLGNKKSLLGHLFTTKDITSPIAKSIFVLPKSRIERLFLCGVGVMGVSILDVFGMYPKDILIVSFFLIPSHSGSQKRANYALSYYYRQ